MTDRTYLAIAPHVWGTGPTPTEAILAAPSISAPLKDYIVWLMPEGATDAHVDQMGSTCWTWTDGADRAGEPVLANTTDSTEDIADKLSDLMHKAYCLCILLGLDEMARTLEDEVQYHSEYVALSEELENASDAGATS